MNKEIYLSDEQYVDLLGKVEKAIEVNNYFQVIDSTEIGNKYTTSNIGLCNENFTEFDTALFPEQFLEHGRTSMKYRKNHHICPFDTRMQQVEQGEATNLSNGCYYTCSLRTRTSDKEKMFNLVAKAKELFHTGTSQDRIERLNKEYFSR